MLGIDTFPPLRLGLTWLSDELSLLLARDDRSMYGAAYYGAGRRPLHRRGVSGYERYDRASSNANRAAYILWKHFHARRSLDVGCALGFVVEALAELGLDACGSDVSAFALNHAASSVRSRLFFGDLSQHLPFGDGAFDLVSALETLEHLHPERVDAALAELFRVCSGHLVATIPSFGPNAHGPGGWFQGKVRPERVKHYQGLGHDYPGPVPREDLAVDALGRPIEGHLTIASFEWWRGRFAAAGFVHQPRLEQRIYRDLDRFGLVGWWNLYVFSRPGVEISAERLRPETELREVEARWRL
jgi:SAM-dependent methyltransferase